MDSVLTAAILPLLNATDKKKIKDAIVTQIVNNPDKYIDLSLDVDMNDIVNTDDVRFAIGEAVTGLLIKSFKSSFKK